MDIIQLMEVFFTAAAGVAYARLAGGGGGAGVTASRLMAGAAACHAAATAAAVARAGQLQLSALLSALMLLLALACLRHLTAAATRQCLLFATMAALAAPLLMSFTGHAIPVTLSAHSVLALLVYGCATAAFILCVDLYMIEQRLRQTPQTGGGAFLARENRYFNYMLAAFLLLTLTLATGIIASLRASEPIFALTHKNLFAYSSWLIFLALTVGRYIIGWRGRALQRWFFIACACLLLSYIGSTIVREVIIAKAG